MVNQVRQFSPAEHAIGLAYEIFIWLIRCLKSQASLAVEGRCQILCLRFLHEDVEN
jgi:hypothetical protein